MAKAKKNTAKKTSATTTLPDGEWTITEERGEGRFWLIATCGKTGDEMRSQVIVGDLAGYDRETWELPRDLQLDKIWHLQRTEPRRELARGGMKAIVGHLAKLADQKGVWVTTEVDPQNEKDVPRMLHINRKYGGFRSCTEYDRMMVRATGHSSGERNGSGVAELHRGEAAREVKPSES